MFLQVSLIFGWVGLQQSSGKDGEHLCASPRIVPALRGMTCDAVQCVDENVS